MRREGRRRDQGRAPALPQAQAALNLFSNSGQMRISGGHSSERPTLGTEGTRDHRVLWGQSDGGVRENVTLSLTAPVILQAPVYASFTSGVSPKRKMIMRLQ